MGTTFVARHNRVRELEDENDAMHFRSQIISKTSSNSQAGLYGANNEEHKFDIHS
jgi:hypothetical protein